MNHETMMMQLREVREITVDGLTREDAAMIVDRLIASGKDPASMTNLERAAVRIVWAELEISLAPVQAAVLEIVAAFGAVAEDVARSLRILATAFDPVIELEAPARRQQTFPGSRPAWQRRA